MNSIKGNVESYRWPCNNTMSRAQGSFDIQNIRNTITRSQSFRKKPELQSRLVRFKLAHSKEHLFFFFFLLKNVFKLENVPIWFGAEVATVMVNNIDTFAL